MRLALLVVLAGCDWSLHRMQEQPKCGVDRTLFGEPCDRELPDGVVAWQPEPPPVPKPSRALVERGRDRFQRVCAPCHGILGDGDSDVARAMTLRRPPPLVDATVSGFDDARILRAITDGYGMMPSYAGLLATSDRYAVLYYLRVLQHRDAPLDELTAEQRQEATQWLR
jgi:mono/diheme cytochrome c family protein